MAKPIGSNKENLERTRAQLLSVARECFAVHGYQKTSTTMVVEAAESSRGSLYHHFRDKKALFKAVYDELCQEIAQDIEGYAYKGVSPAEDLVDGCIAYLGAFVDEVFAQIMLIDGPNVLGMDYCRSQDRQTGYKALKEGVAECISDEHEALMLTDFLSGALDTFALRIATEEKRKQALNQYSRSFRRLALKLL